MTATKLKIGDLSSIVVKIGVQSSIPSERNPRRQGKSGATAVEEQEAEPGYGCRSFCHFTDALGTVTVDRRLYAMKYRIQKAMGVGKSFE
ncbi:hypothetical protein L1887_35750 [Cichorium endivia]|nr:hypothetical protein L1887_35750 [Cichorium endivia]